MDVESTLLKFVTGCDILLNKEIIPISTYKNTIYSILSEKLDLCVISFGGCSSNTLVNSLEEQGLKCKTPIWDSIVCHCPFILPDIKIPIIYLYRDPKLAFLSMKRRMNGFWDVNQRKLSNNNNIELSDEQLIILMLSQFLKWTNYIQLYKPSNVCLIKYEELFEPDIKTTLQCLVGKELSGFPIPYVEPKSININPTEEENNLFFQYRYWFDYVNNFSLRNF